MFKIIDQFTVYLSVIFALIVYGAENSMSQFHGICSFILHLLKPRRRHCCIHSISVGDLLEKALLNHRYR
jgi:hypothetical protein